MMITQQVEQTPVTPNLVNVLSYTTGVESNDKTFKAHFPYLALPSSGFGNCGGALTSNSNRLYPEQDASLKLGTPEVFMTNYPNPSTTQTTFKYRVQDKTPVTIKILDETGKLIDTPVNNETVDSGTHELNYNVSKLTPGFYFAIVENNNQTVQSIKFSVTK